MFNIGDIVQYSILMNPTNRWGVIVEILEVKDSVSIDNKGSVKYRVNSLIDYGLTYDYVKEKDILKAYSMYFEDNRE